ncbi:MAG TPA: DUF2442 domain-containing protein [Candidatus Kapabacteria bacterium]|nr:DUF2442 domain-containing protein [Candidatus Kapabacteria bacterium]
MNSLKHGKPILTGSVTNISNIGFWILVNDKEYFVPFSNYPEFKNAKIDEIFKMKLLSPRQLYWQSLDCDIELDALEAPERFPLRFHKQ